jgi:Bacterial regulatory proteins, luxR family
VALGQVAAHLPHLAQLLGGPHAFGDHPQRQGLSNAQIAERLFLSESTIKQHLRAAYKALGVSNRTEAVRLIRSH